MKSILKLTIVIFLLNIAKVQAQLYGQEDQVPFKISALINKTINAYSTLKYYSDSGKVITSIYVGSTRNGTAKKFSTLYRSDGLFNFEFYNVGSSNSLYLINIDGSSKIRSWWGLNNKTTIYKSINDAIRTAQGVSSLTSIIIPGLLLKKRTNCETIFDNLKKPKFAGTEQMGNKTYYKIEGMYNSVFDVTIWVDQETYFVTKIVTLAIIKEHKVTSVYNISPSVPMVIDLKRFDFRPNRQTEL